MMGATKIYIDKNHCGLSKFEWIILVGVKGVVGK